MKMEINRKYVDLVSRWSGKRRRLTFDLIKKGLVFNDALRLMLFPFLLLIGPLLIIYLRSSIRRHSHLPLSPLHNQALSYIDSFIHQYPLHLYPIVAKALELAYLKNRLTGLLDKQIKVVEVAIGEGTLSARLFAQQEQRWEQRVTALDLNPYSLIKAARLKHVGRAIVCDGMRPPLRRGGYDLLIANNFLHHVTQKEATIGNWAEVAKKILFNENTPFWASGWTFPYLLKKIGLKGWAARRAAGIAEHSVQHLESQGALAEDVSKTCEIEDQRSFMSERTFFYSSLFSFLMRSYGPPTPPLIKKLLLGPLRSYSTVQTKRVAELLIRYDAYQDRETDTFVFFSCNSRTFRPAVEGLDLICPRCEGALDVENRCKKCGKVYPVKDGMLFLLPEELGHVAQEYSSEVASSIPDEHL